MTLAFNPNNQIIFQKFSNERMGGIVEIRNPSLNNIFSFKIKCTNPQLFQVSPLKGVLRPGESLKVQFVSIDAVNLDFAKQLVMNHKFLIEYAPITSEYAVANFKSHECQRKKFYLNMDSLRNGSKLIKDNDKMQLRSQVSNRMSYISMKNEMKNDQNRVKSEFLSTKIQIKSSNHQQMQQNYSRLKEQLEDLHQQRQSIVNKIRNNRNQTTFSIKKTLIFIIFLVIGTFLGTGIKKYNQYLHEQWQLERKKLSEQQSGWNFFGLFKSLYDEDS